MKPKNSKYLAKCTTKSLNGCVSLLAASVLFACGAEPERSLPKATQSTETEKKAAQQSPTEPLANPNSQDAELAKPRSLDLVDPADARILIVAQPELGTAGTEGVLQVPKLTLALRQADSAWVLRCNSGYTVSTVLGEDVFSLPADSPTRIQQMRWAWQEALGSSQNCVQVASHLVSSTLEDLSAPDGEYFYLLNPCVLKEKSRDKNEVCSYQLVKTTVVKATNKLSGAFILAAQKVADADATHAALLLKLRYFAELVQLNREACEHNDAVSRKQENLWKGLGSLLAGGIGAMASGVLSGGTTALQGAKGGLNFALNIFGKHPHVQLQCPIIAETLKAAQDATAALPEAQKKILAARNELAKLNAEYASVDEKIMEEN